MCVDMFNFLSKSHLWCKDHRAVILKTELGYVSRILMTTTQRTKIQLVHSIDVNQLCRTVSHNQSHGDASVHFVFRALNNKTSQAIL